MILNILEQFIEAQSLPYKEKRQMICDFIDKEVFLKAPEIDQFSLHLQEDALWFSFSIDHTPLFESGQPQTVTTIEHWFSSFFFVDYPEYKEFFPKLWAIRQFIWDTFHHAVDREDLNLTFSMPHRQHHRTMYVSIKKNL